MQPTDRAEPQPPRRRSLGRFLSHPGWTGISGIVGVLALGVTIAVILYGDRDQPGVSPPTTSTSASTSAGTHDPSGPPLSREDGVATPPVPGGWSVEGGDLTVTVTKVTKSPEGALRLHVQVANGSAQERVLPLSGITAKDDQGQIYTPSNDPAHTRWPGSLAPHGSFTGVVQTRERAGPQASYLKITFARIFGDGATPPPDGLTIAGLDLPRRQARRARVARRG
ncbi:hypothetical protein ACWGE1_02540 [Streptomyces sp. NPDC054932]